jgi:hypothetical protein
MHGAIPPFLNTPSLGGAQLKKHRDNFTFTLLLSCARTAYTSEVGTHARTHALTPGIQIITNGNKFKKWLTILE